MVKLQFVRRGFEEKVDFLSKNGSGLIFGPVIIYI